MNFTFKIIYIWFLSFVSSQTENTEKLDSCNVVCNCNGGPPTNPLPQSQAIQGPPGKRGGKGGIGIPGRKGEKGETGLKGQKGNAQELSMTAVLNALSATTCKQLQIEFGVSTNGYYLIRSMETSFLKVVYCDFTVYTGVQNCTELQERYNISQAGFYLFGNNIANGTFHYCVPTAIGVYTCQQLIQRHPELPRRSGFYNFQTPGLKPFRVYCNFSQSTVITEVHHNLMIEEILISDSCEENGCFRAAPSYDVTGTDLIKIISNSNSCKQFIKLKCRGVVLLNGLYSWWVSRNGEKMSYWGGSLRNGYCACGETNSCIDNSYKCNCDQNSGSITTSDEGYLTDKTKLPVKEIRVGDHGDSSEMAWYTIGKLECSG